MTAEHFYVNGKSPIAIRRYKARQPTKGGTHRIETLFDSREYAAVIAGFSILGEWAKKGDDQKQWIPSVKVITRDSLSFKWEIFYGVWGGQPDWIIDVMFIRREFTDNAVLAYTL